MCFMLEGYGLIRPVVLKPFFFEPRKSAVAQQKCLD